LHIELDRPDLHNALSPQMYGRMDEAIAGVGGDSGLRAVTFRGVGGAAFVAGSDIGQFASFEGPADGVGYEARMDAFFDRVAAISVPTVAVIDGWAIGAGLNLAACCDIRIAAEGARFGVPIAKTVGNCLSMQTIARLVAALGEGRVRRMLILAEMIDAEEAMRAGFLSRLVPQPELDVAAADVLRRILGNAPLTLQAGKAALRRLTPPPDDAAEDLIGAVYGSADFRKGVQAFLGGETPQWAGR
jgi:enoyl-CoA hydratase/carnithine racemase